MVWTIDWLLSKMRLNPTNHATNTETIKNASMVKVASTSYPNGAGTKPWSLEKESQFVVCCSPQNSLGFLEKICRWWDLSMKLQQLIVGHHGTPLLQSEVWSWFACYFKHLMMLFFKNHVQFQKCHVQFHRIFTALLHIGNSLLWRSCNMVGVRYNPIRRGWRFLHVSVQKDTSYMFVHIH